MAGLPLVAPLAPDIEALRQSLIDNPLPPVWQLDAATARRLHREVSLAAGPSWRPDVGSLPVVARDIAASPGIPAMREYQPIDPADDGPCVVWLHGGGWVLGDLDTTDASARTACAVSGWPVLSVDYRCAPMGRFPHAVDDTLAAVDWALDHWARVVVGGDSAGGNLAAVAAQQRGARLAGQVLVYPTSDPRLTSASAHEFVDGPFLTRRDMEWFYEQYLRGEADADSPLVDLTRGFGSRGVHPVPAVVLTVGHDPLRDEGIAYARLLADSGHRVEWIHAPDLHHGAYSNSGYLPSAAVRVEQVWSAARRLFT